MPKRTIILITILSALLAFSLYRWSSPPLALELEVTDSGEILSAGQTLTLAQVETAMRAAVNDDPEATVIIVASAKTEAGAVVQVVQVAEKMGLPVDVILGQ